MGASSWANFWKSEGQPFAEIMDINTGYFANQAIEILGLKPGDQILDYGCGPGLLSNHLAPAKIYVAGADINPHFLEQCRRNHEGAVFIHISEDFNKTQKILEVELPNKRFDFIVVLSIIQYFKNEDEVKCLFDLLVPYLKQNGKIVVADCLNAKTSAIRDVISLLFQSIRRWRATAFIKFIFYLLFSNYRSISNDAKLLRVSNQLFLAIAEKHNLSLEEIKGLTIHSSRTNFVLKKAN